MWFLTNWKHVSAMQPACFCCPQVTKRKSVNAILKCPLIVFSYLSWMELHHWLPGMVIKLIYKRYALRLVRKKTVSIISCCLYLIIKSRFDDHVPVFLFFLYTTNRFKESDLKLINLTLAHSRSFWFKSKEKHFSLVLY